MRPASEPRRSCVGGIRPWAAGWPRPWSPPCSRASSSAPSRVLLGRCSDPSRPVRGGPCSWPATGSDRLGPPRTSPRMRRSSAMRSAFLLFHQIAHADLAQKKRILAVPLSRLAGSVSRGYDVRLLACGQLAASSMVNHHTTPRRCRSCPTGVQQSSVWFLLGPEPGAARDLPGFNRQSAPAIRPAASPWRSRCFALAWAIWSKKPIWASFLPKLFFADHPRPAVDGERRDR